MLDTKSRSTANIAKNPLINKHIDSGILTLNSDKEEHSKEKSNENETSSIIDSDNFEENNFNNIIESKQKIKNNSIIGKVNLKKLDLQRATQEVLILSEENRNNNNNKKLNYHRRKKANLNNKREETSKHYRSSVQASFAFSSSKNKRNNNSGNITAKYIKGIDNAGNHSRGEYDNANLLKKFSLWKTIDNEITNTNFEDLKKSIRILEYFIRVLKVISILLFSPKTKFNFIEYIHKFFKS